MVNLISEIKNSIKEEILSAYYKACEKGLLDKESVCEIEIDNTKEKKFGDFATNFALKMSKTLGKNPREIASKLVDEIDDTGFIKKAEVAGPGFINFFLQESWLHNNIKYILENPENFGKVKAKENKKIMVEYISANPTGPMHIGNARGGAMGDTLANLLKYAGYDVSKEFYVNDYGNQI